MLWKFLKNMAMKSASRRVSPVSCRLDLERLEDRWTPSDVYYPGYVSPFDTNFFTNPYAGESGYMSSPNFDPYFWSYAYSGQNSSNTAVPNYQANGFSDLYSWNQYINNGLYAPATGFDSSTASSSAGSSLDPNSMAQLYQDVLLWQYYQGLLAQYGGS